MQVGDIFTLTDDVIAKLDATENYNISWVRGKGDDKQTFSLEKGMQFRISMKVGLSLLPVEVCANMLDSVTGKAKRGRPRRFPAGIVAELLGEDPADLIAPQPVVVAPVDDQNDLSDAPDEPEDVVPVVAAPVAKTECSDEEKAARAARVNKMLGLVDDNSDSTEW